MLYVFLIFLSTFSLNENVLGNSCENDNCTSAIDIPLITHLNAPLKAELDISILTEQLKELIRHEVKQAVSTAMKDLAENIVDKRAEIALDNLKTYNNLSISTFQKDIEDDCVRKDDFQDLYKKQTLTESRLSFIESKVKRTAERVAMTAHLSSQGTISNVIMKFNDVKYSVHVHWRSVLTSH